MLQYFTDLISSTDNSQDGHHIFVNVYDMIQPNYLTQFGYYALGVGVFHSGVEISGKEYCFGGHDVPDVTGVFVVEPKIGIPELSLKQTIDMGTTNLTDKEIEEMLLSISDEFTGPSYNLLTRNCNHFTEEFITRLNNKVIPTWINRAARLGNMFPCVVPWEWIQPPELAEEEEEAAEQVAEPAKADMEDEDECYKPSSRRSSTVSLLGSSKYARSSYHSIREGRSSSQERLINTRHYHPPITSKFQGIINSGEEH